MDNITEFLSKNSIVVQKGIILKSKNLSNGFIKVTMEGTWPNAPTYTTIYPEPGKYISWPMNRITENINLDFETTVQSMPISWKPNPML